MRARNLKPGFFKNEELAEVSFSARILFAGLWGMADRKGRLEDRPKRIQAEVFPYDRINIEKLLDVITSHGFIVRYTVDENHYIQIINFEKHQTPHPHEAKSNIPPCNDIKRNVMLNPDVRNPDVRNPESLSPAATPLAAKAAVFNFEAVWSRYPRKLGKDDASRHFKVQVKTTQDFLDIQHAMDRFLQKLNKDGTEEKYIPHGSTWFNKRWRDWINYTEVMPHARNDGQGVHYDDDFRRRARHVAGLRKADFQGPAGKVLDAIRDGSLSQDAAQKPK